MELVAEHPVGDALHHLRAADVAARAALTHGAFYGHFGSQEGFRVALLEHLFDPDRLVDQMAEVAAVTAGRDGVVDAIGAAMSTSLDLTVNDPAWKASLALWCQADPDYDRLLEERYAGLTEELVGILGEVLERASLYARPPLTIRTIAAALIALLDGSSIRSRLTPEAADDEVEGEAARKSTLFPLLVLALLSVLTTRDSDGPNLFEFIDEHLEARD